MKSTYSVPRAFGSLTVRMAALAAVGLLSGTAAAVAWKYDVGPNYVNMPGSACRGETSTMETDLYHDSGATAVKSGRGLHRLLCPIQRRGTGFYGKAGWERNVKLVNIDLRGGDSSTAHTYSCTTFITDMYNQSTTWGAARYLCQSPLGCSSQVASWTGVNTMKLNLPANGNTISTVNFGVMCDIGSLSSIDYYEALVTPNP